MNNKRSRRAFETDPQKLDSPFVLYGTPFPPLDDHAQDDGSYVPVWKQEVTDDRGRKRLHGAFTGGFSAGYFNTVGSKEGWTPSTFVSSRANRAKDNKSNATRTAEDYMDEEDIREAEESRQLSTTNGFAGFGTEDDLMHRNAVLDLFRPADESIGFKLLNKMGWKQGQGIGPRVKRRADADDPTSEIHSFAPDDVPMISFTRKADHKGIGFNEGPANIIVSGPKHTATAVRSRIDVSESEDDTQPTLSFTGRSKKPTKAREGAFGVGILNDTGSDDEDPYSMGPKISYNRTIGGDKKSKKKAAQPASNANPLLANKPVFVSKKMSSMKNLLRKCHDGRLPLPGFVLADELDGFSTMSIADNKYKPLEVPESWRPARLAASAADTRDSSSTYQSTTDLAKASNHTASSRASALGETLLPGKSVFDYLTPSTRDRIAKTSGKTNLPQALGETLTGTSAPVKSVADLIPPLDSETASQALSRSAVGGFMPYAEDLAKRQRYKIFLEISAGIRQNEFPARPSGSDINNEDYINELNEFVRAAEVFRPVSGGLGSRFTSSSASSTLQSSTASSDPNQIPPNDLDRLVTRSKPKPEDPAEVAAKLGMFGPLTRSFHNFQPTRLVAKRFGVEYIGPIAGAGIGQVPSSSSTSIATPYPQTPSNPPDLSSTYSTSTSIPPSHRPTTDLESDLDALIASASHPSPAPTADPTSTPLPSTTPHQIDTTHNSALEAPRPGIAVFKAIFGSDDEDDRE